MDGVAWDLLEHAYGDAGDVPDMLAALRHPDTNEEALYELYGSILHQGSVYSATGPAMREIAVHAADTSADTDTQESALSLMTGFAEAMDSVEQGATGGVYPELVAILDDLRAALTATLTALPTLLRSDDAVIRTAAAEVAAAAGAVSDDVIAGLHAALVDETHNGASAALATAIQRHDALTSAESALLAEGDPSVAFVAAWAAVRAGAHTSSAEYARCGALWSAGRSGLANMGIDDDEAILALVNARGADLLPLLGELGHQRDTLREALVGYSALAAASRAVTPAVVTALIELTRSLLETGIDLDTPWDPLDVRRIRPRSDLLDALSTVLPDAHDQSLAVRDLIHAVATAGAHPADHTPFSVRGSGPHSPTDIRANAALALLLAGDERWQGLYIAAQQDLDTESVTVSTRASRAPFPNAVATHRMSHLDLGEVAPFLAAHPKRLGSWGEVLRSVPGAADHLDDENLIAALPHATKELTRLLLARDAASAVPAMRERLTGELFYGARTWLLTALAVLTGSPDDIDALDALFLQAAKQDASIENADEAYPYWEENPTPAFAHYQVRLIKNRKTTSFYDRLLLLMVVRDCALELGIETVWDAGYAPLSSKSLLPWWGEGLDIAVPTELALTRDGAAHRGELIATLTALLDSRGADATVIVSVAPALVELGALTPEDAIARLLTALPNAGRRTRSAVETLLELAGTSSDAREHAVTGLLALMDHDERFAGRNSFADAIAHDVHARAEMHRGLALLGDTSA